MILEKQDKELIGLTNRGQMPREHRDLILDAQMIHDWVEPEDWKAELEKLAAKYELTCPDMEEE